MNSASKMVTVLLFHLKIGAGYYLFEYSNSTKLKLACTTCSTVYRLYAHMHGYSNAMPMHKPYSNQVTRLLSNEYAYSE